MSSDQTAHLAATTEKLRAESSVPGLLRATARAYVDLLEAPACTISRVIGDLLVDLVQYQREGSPDRLGHGYLISDYPLTRIVIEDREPRTVFVGDADADPAEEALLRELGYEGLLMVALAPERDAWGLIEVYGEQGRRFTDQEVELAQGLADEAGELLVALERS